MKNIYVYTFIIGVILFIAGLWLSQRVEGFQGTFGVLLAGIGTGGIVYVADSGLTNSPNWSNISGSFTQISGSMGQIVGVNSSKEVWYTRQASPGIESTWKKIPGTATQVAFDFPKVLAVMGDSVGYISDVSVANPAFTMKNGPVGFKWIDISLGGSYAIGKNNKIYSCADITASNWSWTDITTGVIVGKTFMQLSCDGGNVAVVTESNELYYARDGRTWFQLTGQAVKGVAVRGRMLYALGTDNKIYYSPSQIPNASWSSLSGTVAFSYIDCILPINAQIISERTAGNASCENPTYELVGGQCMSPCPSGYTANGTTCVQGSTTRATRDATLPAEVTYNCPSGEIQLSGAVCRSTQDDKVVSNNAPPKEAYAVTGSFTQIEAQAKCESYGATLASDQQVTNAQEAGAGWAILVDGRFSSLAWGWITDNTNNIGQLSTTTGPGSRVPLKRAGGTEKSGAICYGVKPSRSFKDVTEFYFGKWNQVEQCDFGYRVVFNASCKSSCPPESISDPTYCTYKATPKLSKAKKIVNFTCPDGFDDPSVTSCSKFKYNDTTQMIECDTPAPICYKKCPAGYTRNGTTCTPNPGNTASNLDPITQPAHFLIGCAGLPGYTQSADKQTCSKCPTGYTINGTTCTPNPGNTTPVNTPAVNTPPVNTPPITILSQNATLLTPNIQPTASVEPTSIAPTYDNCPPGYTLDRPTNYCTNIPLLTTATTIFGCSDGTRPNSQRITASGPPYCLTGAAIVPTCPINTYLNSGLCYTSQCPPGYTQRLNVCTNLSPGTANPCPSNYTFMNGKCISSNPCPANYTLTNGQCVPNNPCPTGYTLTNGQCVAQNPQYTCPSNYDLVGTTCYQKCPAGYTRNGTTCTPT